VAGPGYFDRWALAQQNGGAGRMSIWHVGLLAFKQNWLVGAGYANFPFAYDRAFIHVYESFYAQWHRASHNIVLGTAVELGAIGLILLVAGWVAQFRTLRFIQPADVRFPLRLALEGALIALFVSGFFLDIMIEKYVWLAFMLVALTYNTSVPSPAPTPAVESPA
jgi:O-antigen ligase